MCHLVTYSIFLAILEIEGFPFFLGDVCGKKVPKAAESEVDISGSNKTMQNALVSIV